jgi:hypothetical protein
LLTDLPSAAKALLEMVDLLIANAPPSIPSGHVLEPYADRLRLALSQPPALPGREELTDQEVDRALAVFKAELPELATAPEWKRAQRAGMRAALALHPARAEEWRPIEEAPRDGTPVDLWVEWPPESGPDKPEAHGSRYANSRFDIEYTEWVLGTAGFRESQYAVRPRITHFRDLPPPPKPEVEG